MNCLRGGHKWQEAEHSTSRTLKNQGQPGKLNQEQVDLFIDACAKELAARLLAKVIKRTPVGDYPNSSGKKVAHFAGVGLVERIQVLLLMLIH